MTIADKLLKLGHEAGAAQLVVLDRFHVATRVGDLVYTSGQVSADAHRQFRGKVGHDLTLEAARSAAELCTVNCLRAVAAVADLESIDRVVKVFGMVNVAPGFDDTTGVINGCSELLAEILGERGVEHTRSAVGMVIPGGWAVEIEMIVALR